MSLSNLIRKRDTENLATANPAISAAQPEEAAAGLAALAALALATPEEAAPADPFALVRAWRRMRAAGFTLTVESDGLVVTPASGLSDLQREYLRSHKGALVALLSDAETLAATLMEAGPAGLALGEGTPATWPVDRLMASGEVLYSDNRMVNRMDRRYLLEHAPAVIDAGPDIRPANVLPMDRDAYEERAAIMEFDGGLPRDEAERKALALAIRAQELRAEGWDAWNAKARAESESLPGWERGP